MARNRLKTPIQAPSLVDVVYKATRDDILRGEIAAGAPVTELGLAARYDVARPTAKASMERLVHDGLLRRATNKSARVPIMNESDIRDVYFARTLIEREVVRALAAESRAPSAALDSLAEFRVAAEKPCVPEIVRLDTEFHQALVSALKSPRLNRLYSTLKGEADLCMAQVQAHHLLSPLAIASEHVRILEHIKNGDPDGADQFLTEHLDRACERLVAYLIQEPL
jgi:DNA-binding GntR family transcriptional regulator